MVQKIQLSTDKSARKVVRDRTENLMKQNKKNTSLPTKAPEYLEGIAKDMYELLAKELNKTEFVTSLDQSSLESFAINYQLLRESYKALNDYGAIYRAPNGDLKRNPVSGTINTASSAVQKFGASLGMTPASRASLIALAPKETINAEDLENVFG